MGLSLGKDFQFLSLENLPPSFTFFFFNLHFKGDGGFGAFLCVCETGFMKNPTTEVEQILTFSWQLV